MGHAIDRTKQRYGFDFVPLAKMRDEIRNHKGVLMARLRNGRERWMIQIEGVVMIVVCDAVSKNIITALPRNTRMAKSKQKSEVTV